MVGVDSRERVSAAAGRAENLGVLPPGRCVSSHTLRHNCARCLLLHGVPINYLGRWLGHSSTQATPMGPRSSQCRSLTGSGEPLRVSPFKAGKVRSVIRN